MDPLNLTIPTQHDYTDPTVERDAARLREWLTNLPLMDVAETVRLVLGALESLNQQKLAADLRFECLEVYRTTVQRLFQTVDPLHLRQLALSKLQRQEAIDGIAYVFLSLAGGYKLIVQELYDSGDSGRSDPLFGKALNRAFEQLTYSLLDSYRFYREIQPLLIAESNTLYSVARHSGVLGVSLEADDDTQAPTTAMLYHASMLLSLTDPARLAEGEVVLLFDVLMQYVDRCRIIPGNRWEGNGAGLFLVELQDDKLPVPCTELRSPVNIRDTYLLDATAALEAIRGKFDQTPEKVRLQSPEAMLLSRLLPGEGATRQRCEQRHEDSRYVELMNGMELIHGYLRNSSSQGDREETDAGSEYVKCRMLDSSSRGMKLSWDEGGAGDFRVGDLLGLLEDGAGGQGVRLAIVRSIQVFGEGGVEMGVMLLPGGLGAVSCSVPDQPDIGAVHALFMAADEQEGITATLIAEKGIYEHGRSLLIDVSGREISVSAGRRVFDSPVFDRFEFSAH
jgi:hypothetical protein